MLIEETYTVVIKRMTFPVKVMADDDIINDGLDKAEIQARAILNRLPLSIKANTEYDYEFELESE